MNRKTRLLSVILAISVYLIVRYGWFPNFAATFCEDDLICAGGMLEGFIGLITLALLVGGLVFSYGEYTRQESEMSFQIYEAISNRLTDPEEEAARRWIIINIQPLEDPQLKEEWLENMLALLRDKSTVDEFGLPIGHSYLKKVLNTFDYFGFISENYMNVEGPFLEWMSAPVAKIWERIEPYIDNESELRDEEDYYRSAKYIGKKCVEYRKNNDLGSTFHKDAT